MRILFTLNDTLQFLNVGIELSFGGSLLSLLNLQLLKLFEAILNELHLASADKPLYLQLVNLHPELVNFEYVYVVNREVIHATIVLVLVLL